MLHVGEFRLNLFAFSNGILGQFTMYVASTFQQKIVIVSACGRCKINDLLASFCNLSRSQTSRSQRIRPPPSSQPQTGNDCRSLKENSSRSFNDQAELED